MTRFLLLAAAAAGAVGCSQTKNERADAPPAGGVVPAAYTAPPPATAGPNAMRSFHPSAGFK